MIHRYDTDTQSHILLAQRGYEAVPEVFPRRTRYGDSDALKLGLDPVESVPDVLVTKDAYKAVIADCHARQIFPMYHQHASWAPVGFQYNQNGLGYCWTWSGTGAVMDVRATEGKETVLLAPVSMGYLVGWANRGNYLESFIEGAKNDGICPAINGDVNSHQNSASTWAGLSDKRKLYRLGQVWDTNPKAGDDVMIQHCLSILAYGRPLYIAYNWWSHALCCVGMRWDESVLNNIVWVIRNSHNESDLIELTGSKGVPDEAYGFISTQLTE